MFEPSIRSSRRPSSSVGVPYIVGPDAGCRAKSAGTGPCREKGATKCFIPALSWAPLRGRPRDGAAWGEDRFFVGRQAPHITPTATNRVDHGAHIVLEPRRR